ncbi:efflux RND transporter periplasmic adaptor subunit [Limnohabitans sp. Bal53]|uniref:efflux RND transporter periplasmic adaptor subunit n=1 Tax=Limnohabitans sp. Bal53 TaxID=1977910 RepID=UPI000D378DBD|nr:efflux RND transporter periplasmic adaptor subunit [Limnohabitans sp. Bal53]PUE39769.1 efflux transporter periplasmic adaptor subunit [Limnohabitans sp. Bal53]
MNRRSILAAAMAFAGLTSAPVWANADAAAVKSVAAQASAAGAQEASLDAVVEAVRQATLSAQVPGAIVSLNVKAGDRVRAGQELLRIDASAAQQNVVGSTAQLEAAQANLRVASKELDRQKQLFQKQYISQGALERAQAQYDAAQAQVQAQQAQTRAAQTQTGFFSVRAPFHGVVTDVPVTLGDMAMPGRPLVTLHDPSALRVSAAVPQSMIPGVRNQLKAVRYEIAGHTSVAAASVQLLPAVDPVTHTAQLRLALPAGVEGLVPGMFARVWVPGSSASAAAQNGAKDAAPAGRVFLPLTAIVRRAEMTGVYVKDAQGQPRLRQVRLGRTTGQTVEVLSGVSAGEQVVTEPATLGKKL